MRGQSRRQFLRCGLPLVGLGLLAGCGTAPPWGQQPRSVPRIGHLAAGSAERPAASVAPFLAGLRELGWIEGQNIAIEYRRAGEGVEEYSDLAAELVRFRVDIILAVGTLAALAASEATGTIPIVFSTAGDPVASGLVTSLARPGGNVTGLSQVTPQLAGKRLELLTEAAPRISRVVMFSDPTNPANVQQWAEMQIAARSLRLELQLLDVRHRDDLGAAFEAASKGQAEALITFEGPLLNRSTEIDDFAAARRLPSMHARREHVEAGGLMAYGPNTADLARRSATFVDKILKGAKPGDLPVEQPTTFDFVINLKTAQALGLTIPPSVLAQATEVIK